jgi:hypothetical protein
MKANFTLKLNHMLKKTIISSLLIGAVALAVASSGGGNKKKSDLPRKPEFTPIRTTNGFTLKAGPVYSGSSIFSSERSANTLTYNTVITYQKGNSVIILPHQSRLNTTISPSLRSNLNFLDLKIRLRLHK